MKSSLIILFLLLCSTYSNAQETKENFFFNEVSILANRTLGYDQNTVGQFGFGIGLNRVMFRKKRVNLTVGMGYNQLRIKRKEVDLELYEFLTDAKYTMYDFSIPIGIRYNIGENKRFFIEGGGRIDLLLATKVRATKTSYPPFPSKYHSSTEISEVNKVTDMGHFYMGAFLGFGFRIPLNDFHSLYIKANYSYSIPGPWLLLSDNDYFILSYAKIAVVYSFSL